MKILQQSVGMLVPLGIFSYILITGVELDIDLSWWRVAFEVVG